MPWRGPEYPGEFPTLGYLVAEWIEESCAVPDRHLAGDPLVLSDEQLSILLWEYRLWPDAVVDPNRPSAPFVYNGVVIVRPQKWGKGPLSSADICAQAQGPVLFAGWDANGEPVGMPWPKPHIQVAAVSTDQTDNIWRALVPMIELGNIAADIPDTGLTRINLPNGGLIEPVTSSARSRLGQRITAAYQDETHSWTKRNDGHKLADTQRRNLAGTGGRWFATTNAFDPSENSVAQQDIEQPTDDVRIDYPTPLTGSWNNKRDRRRILKHAYQGAPWVDLDRIEHDCQRLANKGDPGQAERFFGNRIVAAASAAFDATLWKTLASTEPTIAKGRKVTVGFDGARRRDSTAIVVTDIETGDQMVVGYWARPPELHPDDDWEIPESEVDETMLAVADQWDLWRGYCDPPWWESTVDKWAGKIVDNRGQTKIVSWWTNRRRPMAYALQAYKTAMVSREVHWIDNGTNAAAFIEHIGNARRVNQTGMLDEDGQPLWLIAKDRPDSPRKIDIAMAACLSWEARGDALAGGALNEQPAASGWAF